MKYNMIIACLLASQISFASGITCIASNGQLPQVELKNDPFFNGEKFEFRETIIKDLHFTVFISSSGVEMNIEDLTDRSRSSFFKGSFSSDAASSLNLYLGQGSGDITEKAILSCHK